MRATLRRLLRGPESAPRGLFDPEPDLAQLSEADRAIVDRSLPHTLTGIARLQALIDATRYCARRDVPGAFVECGVWLGGSVVAMILTLLELGVTDRDVYLYDTFEGMTAPTDADTSALDRPAVEVWEATGGRPFSGMFDQELFNEEAVRDTVLSTGYPGERLHFVRGPVEETLPDRAPTEVALLRLDTDWYESTRHELTHLYPRLSPGGVLIIDDYGHWQGARRAVDEYFASEAAPLLLHRIDYAARIAIKH